MASQKQLSIVISVLCMFDFVTSKISEENKFFSQDKITPDELKSIPKLRDKVKPMLTLKVMQENGYLARFLRASNNDINGAEEMIRQMYKWRKEYNADNVANYTDWSSWFRSYPFKLVEDKSHRPGVISGFKSLDLRRLVLTGNYDGLRQYIIFVLDKCAVNIDRVSKLYGREYSSGYLIFDMNGYSTNKHACLACIGKWIELATNYESYYPELASHIIAVNVPTLFQSVFAIMKPFLTERSQNLIKLYGFDRSEWQPVLFKYFDKAQLTKEFGGTAQYDIRMLNSTFFGS